MTFYDSVISNLKGVVASKKDGVLLNYLDNEYRFITGEFFPLKKLGYDTITEFLKSHKDLFLLQGVGRCCRVFNMVGKIENDSTLDLITLIQNTQPKIKYNNQQTVYHYNQQTGYQPSNPNFHRTYKPVSVLSWEDIRSNNIDLTIYQCPKMLYFPAKNIIGKINKNNLLIPTKCLLNAKRSQNEPDVIIISDSDETIVIVKPQAATQTVNIKPKPNSTPYCTFQAIEFMNIIIDVILASQFVNSNEVLNMSIAGDLYHHFRLLTGLNIEPILFYDYVTGSVESSKCQHLYNGSVSLDESKTKCLFDIKLMNHHKTLLPEYEFDYCKEYIVEIVKFFHNGLVGFKVTNKMNLDLHWKKDVIPEQTKLIIENQDFCSWIPGNFCLVRLPHSIVKRLKISSVERAVIMSTDIETSEKESLRQTQKYLLHRTSFYLLDHDLDIENVLACANSFQDVKQHAKQNNDTDIAFVCNMSVSARNTPSKIQFAKLENYKDISESFIDNEHCKQFQLNSLLVLNNVKKMEYVFHFQYIYCCSSKPHCPAELLRPVVDYKDIELYQSCSQTEGKKIEVCPDSIRKYDIQDKKVGVVLEDFCKSDIESSVSTTSNKKIEICQDDILRNSIKQTTVEVSLKDSFKDDKKNVEMCENVTLQNHTKNNETFQKNNSKIDYQSKNLFQRDYSEKKLKHNFKDVIIISDEEDKLQVLPNEIKVNEPRDCNKDDSEVFPIDLAKNSHCEFSQNNCQINGLDKISIVSYSESEDDLRSTDSISNSHNENGLLNKKKNDKPLPISIIRYLENNANQPRKCLRPLTTDLLNIFHGRIVKLLHIQTGSAVVMLFDSIKLIRREIKLASLKEQNLKVAEKVLVGDFFIWRQQNQNTNNEDILIVEVMQLVSKVSVLTNLVHQGLLAIVNIGELFSLPDDNNGDHNVTLQILIGPSIGAFDLHMFPDWFTPDDSYKFSDQLYTAFFADDGKLILEYFEEPCRFLNFEMIDLIEKSLTITHCNIKSGQFIEMLAKSLVQCKLFIGNLLELMESIDGKLHDLSITKVLCKVTADDNKGVWFASVMVKNECDRDQDYEKLSPHNFLDDQFCIDRVVYDERRQCLRLMDYQNVYVDIPDNGDGLYHFDRARICGPLTGGEEFLTRYMLAGATAIPDLKYLYNKLIFDIRF